MVYSTYYKIRAWKDYFKSKKQILIIEEAVNAQYKYMPMIWKKNYIISRYADYWQWYQNSIITAYNKSEDDRYLYRLKLILKDRFDIYLIKYMASFLIK